MIQLICQIIGSLINCKNLSVVRPILVTVCLSFKTFVRVMYTIKFLYLAYSNVNINILFMLILNIL
jgi:hypothetical protein